MAGAGSELTSDSGSPRPSGQCGVDNDVRAGLREKARARRSDAARAADDKRLPAAEGMRHEPAPYLIGGMGRLASPGRMTKA